MDNSLKMKMGFILKIIPSLGNSRSLKVQFVIVKEKSIVEVHKIGEFSTPCCLSRANTCGERNSKYDVTDCFLFDKEFVYFLI